jgi:hypothetical protein
MRMSWIGYVACIEKMRCVKYLKPENEVAAWEM